MVCTLTNMSDTAKQKDIHYERASFSGYICVTADKEFVLWQRFGEYIKVEIVYDKTSINFVPDKEAEIVTCEKEIEANELQSTPTNLRSESPEKGTVGSQETSCSSSYPEEVLPIHFEKTPAQEAPCLPEQASRKCHIVNEDAAVQNENVGPLRNLRKRRKDVSVADEDCAVESEGQEEDLEEDSKGPKLNRGDHKRKTQSERTRKRIKKSNSVEEVKSSKKRTLKVKNPSKKKVVAVSLKPSYSALRKENANRFKLKRQQSQAENKPRIKKLEIEKDVTCEYCHKMFKSQQEFFDHRKTERTEHKCKHCSKLAPFKAHLLVHMRKHDQMVEEEILSLGEVFKEAKRPWGKAASSMPSGQEIEDKGSKAGVRCDICGMTMSNIPILKTHMMIHTGEYAYKCCVCGDQTHSIGRFNNHMSTHMKAGRVQCKICNISFDSRGELSKHQLTHECICGLCGAKFANKTSRAFHYKMSHKEDILKCPTCGKMYSCEQELKSHLNYHRNRNKTQCTICGLFVSRLDNHILSHTQKVEEGKMFVCDKCPKQFKQKLSFQRHLRTHSEEKPYACMECPKRFSRSGGLRRHMVTHTQEKPFVCDICGKACSQMSNLKIHMQIHKENGPVHCNACGQGFSHKNLLQEHMRSMHYIQMNPSVPFLQPQLPPPLPPVYYS